jgi:hypothetical protein
LFAADGAGLALDERALRRGDSRGSLVDRGNWFTIASNHSGVDRQKVSVVTRVLASRVVDVALLESAVSVGTTQHACGLERRGEHDEEELASAETGRVRLRERRRQLDDARGGHVDDGPKPLPLL